MAKLSQYENFGQFLVDAIDKGLSGLGEIGKASIYIRIEGIFKIKNRKYPISAARIGKNRKQRFR